MRPAISVVMPAYNVEKYLERAVESILAQDFADWELLLVDDGSTDQTGEIAASFAREDARVICIRQENMGAPAARNAAIERARGKYLYFCDADDWAEPALLRTLYAFAEANNLQLALCGFAIETYDAAGRKTVSLHSEPDTVYESQRAFRENAYKLFDKNLLYPPWNKLFLSAYIEENGIRFPETFWDDFPFNLAVVRDVARVGVLAAPLYHFIRERGESETARYREGMYEKREEEHEWMLDLYAHWNVRDALSVEMVNRRYVERLVGCIENAANAPLPRAERLTKIDTQLRGAHVKEALKLARPRSAYMRALLVPLRLRSVRLCYLEGRAVGRVKARNTRLFARLKARR